MRSSLTMGENISIGIAFHLHYASPMAGLRERARDAVRTEIADAMCNLFAERGFDVVTVEEAARAAGISRATFFRYFDCKEDAFLAAVDASSIDYGQLLVALPADADESPWCAVHRVFQRSLDHVDEISARERGRLVMVGTNTSLRARLAERRLVQEESLTRALEQRFGNPDAARPIAATSLAALDLAWRRWAGGEDVALGTAIERVFTQIRLTVPADAEPQ